MKVLHLTIKKKWFDMIASGQKKEEYRDINEFWIKRLCDLSDGWLNDVYPLEDAVEYYPFLPFNQVLFANGGHFGDVPKQTLQIKGIEVGEGLPEWGAEPGKKYFVIKLGERIDQ